ncbi:MAG: prepilin peptidase [Deltaproteobacteria bacterium]|nr:prepilin peptidase [Deltaproteobacteria bacterium]
MIIPSFHPFFVPAIVFVFGAVVGSFLNVCIVRIPKRESVVSPPSHCPRCKTSLRFYDNVPLISYLLLRGRCRFCGGAISARYFFVELMTALLGVALWYRFGLGIAFFIYFAFVASLIVISFVDLDLRIIPDAISLPGIAVGFVASILSSSISAPFSYTPSPMDSFLGILLGGGILFLVAWVYQLLTGKEGMGGGDIKLLAMIGSFLGWASVLLTLFLASLTGSVVGVSFMLAKGVDTKYALPFGPFLCVGAVLDLFFGEELVSFLLSPY